MKTYYIYDFQTNELLLEVMAYSVVDAEVKACIELNKGSEDLYAFSEKI